MYRLLLAMHKCPLTKSANVSSPLFDFLSEYYFKRIQTAKQKHAFLFELHWNDVCPRKYNRGKDITTLLLVVLLVRNKECIFYGTRLIVSTSYSIQSQYCNTLAQIISHHYLFSLNERFVFLKIFSFENLKKIATS